MTTDRVALVTGAGSGIGRATSLALAATGYLVVGADVDETGANETATLAGKLVEPTAMDVTDEASVASTFQRIKARHGRLDVAVNCAGINCAATRLACADSADFDRTIAVNLRGVWLCLREEVRIMRELGGGAIVNVASTAGVVGFPKAAAYVASKHGVVGLTRAAALDHARDGIRVNAVCPGAVATSMLLERAETDPGLIDLMKRQHPINRLIEPDEVARTIAWLAGDESSGLTGAVVPVDGGATAR